MTATLDDKATAMKESICEVSDALGNMESLSPLVKLLTIAYQCRSPAYSEQERLLTLLKTMATDPSASSTSSYTHRQYINSYKHFLSPVLNGMAGLQEFEASVGALDHPGDFRDFWMLEGDNLIQQFVEGNGSESVTIIEGSDLPFLDTFVTDKTSLLALSRETGCLKLVSGEAQVGDVIKSE